MSLESRIAEFRQYALKEINKQIDLIEAALEAFQSVTRLGAADRDMIEQSYDYADHLDLLRQMREKYERRMDPKVIHIDEIKHLKTYAQVKRTTQR